MILFLYGKDTYRLSQKLRTIIGEYEGVNPSGCSVMQWDGEDLDTATFHEAIRSPSLFQEKKLCVVRNIGNSKSGQEEFWQDLASVQDVRDVIVVVTDSGALDKRGRLYKFLLKAGQVQEFEELQGEKLSQWIVKEASSYGIAIDREAREQLAQISKGDLWRASREIAKLASWKRKKGTVSAADVELLCGTAEETSAFAMVDAVAEKNARVAVLRIAKLIAQQEAPHALLSLLIFQFRTLLLVKLATEQGMQAFAIQRELELHPFVARKSLATTRRFSLEELQFLYDRVALLDIRTKTGQDDMQMALYSFAVSI